MVGKNIQKIAKLTENWNGTKKLYQSNQKSEKIDKVWKKSMKKLVIEKTLISKMLFEGAFPSFVDVCFQTRDNDWQ